MRRTFWGLYFCLCHWRLLSYSELHWEVTELQRRSAGFTPSHGLKQLLFTSSTLSGLFCCFNVAAVWNLDFSFQMTWTSTMSSGYSSLEEDCEEYFFTARTSFFKKPSGKLADPKVWLFLLKCLHRNTTRWPAVLLHTNPQNNNSLFIYWH